MGDANNPMILSEIDAAYAADKFIDYFSNTGRIDEYLRNVKLDRMAQLPMPLFGMGPGEMIYSLILICILMIWISRST